MTYPRGSEWRRWDLHVHTPGTILANKFGAWDEYLNAIETQQAVKVIGVTDYMCLDSYSRVRKAKMTDGRLANIDFLLPNLEFRISPPTEKATAVNIHLLVSPEDPNHETRIRDALARLTWEYDSVRYSCLPAQLMALGRAFDAANVSDAAALSAGVLQFKVDFTAFRDWYKSEHWLRQNSLVAVAAGKDGLSGFRRDGAWTALRDEITRFSHILFSGRPAERDFWVGRGSAEEQQTMRRLGGPKPCVHGSDAHEMAKLLKPDGDRFCWIKADPTFEGLRQILYEPADRVFIGPTPPLYHDEARVVRSITLGASNGWFNDATIPLNSGLVAIIGQKGSGKSALAETIAHAGGSWVGDEAGCFLDRAIGLIDGLTVTLEWADGRKSELTLGSSPSNQDEVRYLSQNFVERLCSDDNIGSELVREIEAVVFSYLDEADKLNASDFAELRAIKTEGIRSEGARLLEEVGRLIREECTLRDNIAKLKEKQARINALQEERKGLSKQMPAPISEAEKKLQEQLKGVREAIARANTLSGIDKTKLQRITDIRGRVGSFSGQMSKFYKELEPLLAEAGISAEDQEAFRPSFRSATEPALTGRSAALNKALHDREGDASNPADGTIRALTKRLEELQTHETADKARQEKLRAIQVRLAAIAMEIERIQAEIKHIEDVDKKRVNAVREERRQAYVSYFANLKLEQDALAELYAPVKQRLSSATSEQEQNLEFSVRWEVALGNWLERGSVLFDQRRALPYGTMQGLGEAARRLLLPAWSSGQPEAIATAMSNFLEEFSKLPPASYLRSSAKIQDVLNWLYDADHVQLTYGLKYNGVSLEKLSPGTKGIVLLILYLGMDVNDTRPLIVDQPDENLDNESIYTLLTAYFKTAKVRRQIVLITHNPNLVVNTDAEQIVIAEMEKRENGLPHITYVSGSLENNEPTDRGIRQQVCRILEGGADAFLKRERRYSLSAL
jgi:energy-coupling factor transporter ATP-binding protein EcfA2